VASELKPQRRRRSESESEGGAFEFVASDPKPGDLAMARLKAG
jgi:hypothetical protein